MGHGSRSWYDEATPPDSALRARAYIACDFGVRSFSSRSSRSVSSQMRSRSIRAGALVAIGATLHSDARGAMRTTSRRCQTVALTRLHEHRRVASVSFDGV